MSIINSGIDHTRFLQVAWVVLKVPWLGPYSSSPSDVRGEVPGPGDPNANPPCGDCLRSDQLAAGSFGSQATWLLLSIAAPFVGVL